MSRVGTASRHWRPRAILVALLLTSLTAACGGAPAPTTLGAACLTDSRAPGAFPHLEALLPRGMIERSPDTVDSGANCTAASLGTYTSHGIDELRFAGATWDYGKGDATVVAILEGAPIGPALTLPWVEEFYTVGAVNGRHTGEVKTSRPTMPGAGPVFRLETVNDLSLQTVVIWPAGQLVRVVIVATTIGPDASRAAHDERVGIAVEVAAGVPIP
ncbi:MAG: hypothetical protein ABIZ52_02145 [Candidatus Limnocylindrales bacterium]